MPPTPRASKRRKLSDEATPDSIKSSRKSTRHRPHIGSIEDTTINETPTKSRQSRSSLQAAASKGTQIAPEVEKLEKTPRSSTRNKDRPANVASQAHLDEKPAREASESADELQQDFPSATRSSARRQRRDVYSNALESLKPGRAKRKTKKQNAEPPDKELPPEAQEEQDVAHTLGPNSDEDGQIGGIEDDTPAIPEPLPLVEKLLPIHPDKALNTITAHNAIHYGEHGLCRNIALQKLTSRRAIPLQHLSPQRAQLQQLLSSTVITGQGNSLLLLGSHGAGKSALVSSVLHELSMDPNNVNLNGSPTYHVVRLDGCIQTDDKIALREIWRQLGREMEIPEEETTGGVADTMAKLLGLLSHPDELDGNATIENADAKPNKVSNAVIFLLSTFDAFAARPRQTLLYNLFDIAQSRKAPVAVIGMSTRLDCAEMLEKRVRSRFSHRWVHVPSPKTFDTFLEVCEAAVMVQTDELSYEEHQQCDPTMLAAWNDGVRELLKQEALHVQLRQIYTTTRNVSTALTTLHLPIATLTPSSTTLSPITIPPPILTSATKLSHVSSLPSLSLALFIAAARLPLLTGTPTVSFELAYDEYRSLATKARLAASSGGAAVHSGVAGRVWGKEVARGAWETLEQAGLVGEAGVDASLEEVGAIVKGLQGVGVMGKWCREL